MPQSKAATSSEPLERDIFIHHAEVALDVARAAESSLRATEHHLGCLVAEEELSIQLLKNEMEDVRVRGQAARHQVASLRATLQSEGIAPKVQSFSLVDEDRSPFTLSNSPSIDQSEFDSEDENFV